MRQFGDRKAKNIKNSTISVIVNASDWDQYEDTSDEITKYLNYSATRNINRRKSNCSCSVIAAKSMKEETWW